MAIKIDDKDLGKLLDAPVDARRKVISRGQIFADERPMQLNVRLPARQVEWLRQHIKGNVNYAIMKVMDKAIADLNDRLRDGDFDIEDF